jgi:PhzF family phenazine biosynthesis protein
MSDIQRRLFLMARPEESNVFNVRYFSPKREVPFCGHATIAAAVALAERSPAAELIFHTPAGFVSITTSQNDRGETVAELTSVAPRCLIRIPILYKWC